MKTKSGKEKTKAEGRKTLSATEGDLDFENMFVRGDVIAERLGITEKTLLTLAKTGEFDHGRVNGRIIISRKNIINYLNRHHATGKDNEDILEPTPYIDHNGKLKDKLIQVPEETVTIPELKPIHEFAVRLGLDDRTFIHHCDTGTFYHYRIGSLYKMSEEDWLKSLQKVVEKKMKSSRGRPGRPNEVENSLYKMASDKNPVNDESADADEVPITCEAVMETEASNTVADTKPKRRSRKKKITAITTDADELDNLNVTWITK